MREDTRARLYLPEEIPSDIRQTVKNQIAERYGRYTIVQARGGWINDAEELVEEDVEVLEVTHGAISTSKMRGMARWIAQRTDETEVMWDISHTTVGFEREEDSTLQKL